MPWPIAATVWPVILSGASPCLISSPVGQSAVPPGTRVQSVCWSRSKPLSRRCLLICVDLIAITGASFSIITCCIIFPGIQPSPPSPVTRSRPYKKNDNAHVEQKNWTHVRQLFGYERFDNPGLTTLMNALYANEWSQLQNHFYPTLKLKHKERSGARYRKEYHPPRMPYQRHGL